MVANTVCDFLDSNVGNPTGTATTIANAGSVVGATSESYTLRLDEADGEGLQIVTLASTQLACPEWGTNAEGFRTTTYWFSMPPSK